MYIFPEKKGEGLSGPLAAVSSCRPALQNPTRVVVVLGWVPTQWKWLCHAGCVPGGMRCCPRSPLVVALFDHPALLAFFWAIWEFVVFFFGGPLLVRGWAWRSQEALNALPSALPKHFPELLLAFWGTRGVRALLLRLPGPSRSLVPIRTETLAAVVVAVPPAPGCSVPCLGDGSCRSDALHSGETAGEEAFANQLVEIMIFTSSQLSLGKVFL